MKRVMLLISVVALLLTGLVVVADMESEHPRDQPILVAFDMGFAPFHYYNEQNEPVGYSIDLVKEIARRLDRPGIEVLDVNWSGIFAGLFAEKYEMVIGGVGITHERAENLDYTEPIMTLVDGVAIRPADKDTITSLETLAGHKLGVNAGSTSDTWATENESKYGFQVSRFDKVSDAFMALKTLKIDIVLTDSPVVVERAKEDPGVYQADIAVALETDWGALHVLGTGACFRIGDPYRYEVERAIEGMKLDGTLQKIMAPYFGYPGFPNDANVVYPGYGTPGVRGYEPLAYHEPIFLDEE